MREEELVPRMRVYGTSIFAEMTRLAQETGALNLGQGFPDDSAPAFVLDRARAAIQEGANQYPPGNGVPQLRHAIAQQRKAEYGVAYDPDHEVLVTMGATEAITAAVIALCEPGDEVVAFEPYYDSYAACISIAGARRVPVLLRPAEEGFTFDPDELRRAVGPRTRLLLLNSPHNPTGKVFTHAELATIADLCVERDLIAITDEVYEYITFDQARHRSLAEFPGMRDRTLVASSAGKTFSVTGWKIGWLCGPESLVSAVRTIKQFLTFAGGTPFQFAIAEALGEKPLWVDQLRASLTERRNLLRDALNAADVRTYACEGTYFLQMDARSMGYADGTELCRVLPHEVGVVAIPSRVFYDNDTTGRALVRLAFCKKNQVLTEAAIRLATFARAHANQRIGA